MSRKTILLLVAVSLVAIAATFTFADRSNHNQNDQGGPPACSDLQETLTQSMAQLTQQLQTINTNTTGLSANITQINSRLNTLNTRTNATNTAITQLQTNLTAIGTKIDTQNTNVQTVLTRLQDVVTRLTNIETRLNQQTSCGTTVSAMVNTGICSGGATQCASADNPATTNQNPVQVIVSVMRNGQPVTNLTATDFQFLLASKPTNGPDLTLCTSGSQGCGTGNFFVNNANGTYTLFLHPTGPWTQGTYAAALAIGGGVNSGELIDFDIQ